MLDLRNEIDLKANEINRLTTIGVDKETLQGIDEEVQEYKKELLEDAQNDVNKKIEKANIELETLKYLFKKETSD